MTPHNFGFGVKADTLNYVVVIHITIHGLEPAKSRLKIFSHTQVKIGDSFLWDTLYVYHIMYIYYRCVI